MHYVILSSAREYHTGDWIEDAPQWSARLEDACTFPTCGEALDTLRRHLQADQEAKRAPSFAGCRVARYQDERERLAMRDLRAQGFRASFNEGCTAIWIDFDDKKIVIEKALATFPRAAYGLPVFLRANGRAIKWSYKHA